MRASRTFLSLIIIVFILFAIPIPATSQTLTPSASQEPLHNPTILSVNACKDCDPPCSSESLREGGCSDCGTGPCSGCGGCDCYDCEYGYNIAIPEMPITDTSLSNGRFQENNTQRPFTTDNHGCPDCGCQELHPVTHPCNDCGMRGTSVYLHSGEFYHTRVDLEIPGRGFPFRFERRYKSQITYDGPLGNKWEFNYNMRVDEQGNGDVYYYDGRGRRDTFDWDSQASEWDSPAGYYAVLIEDTQNSEYVLSWWNGMSYHFHSSQGTTYGKLKKIEDRNGNAMTFSYTSGKLTTVTDTLGRDIDFVWDGDQLNYIEDFDDRKVNFTIDGNDDLTEVISPATDTYPYGKKTEYTYDTNHYLLTIKNPDGDVYLSNTYSSGKVTSQKYGVQSGDDVQTITIDYDTPSTGYTKETDRNGNITIWGFNAAGNPTYKKEETNRNIRSGEGDYETDLTYNSDGEMTQIEFPKGNKILYAYDSSDDDPRAHGNLLSESRRPSTHPTDPDHTTTWTYTAADDFNLVKTVVDPRGNLNGANPDDYKTTYYYDFDEGPSPPYDDVDYNEDGDKTGTEGNLVKIKYPEVTAPSPFSSQSPQIIERKYRYNGYGQVTWFKDPEGNINTVEYYDTGTQTGYLKKLIRDYGTGKLNISTQYEYNVVGNITKITDPEGHAFNYDVNELNQVKEIQIPLSATLSFKKYYTFDYNDNVDSFSIDNKDETGSSLDYDGLVKHDYAYNLLNNLTSKEEEYHHDDMGRDTITTTYSYDKNENLELITYPEGNKVKFEYDERDLLYKKILGYGASEASEEEYTYDGNRNMTEYYDGEDDKTTNDYDEYDRLLSKTDAEDNCVEYEYDAADHRTAVIHKDDSSPRKTLAKTEYKYDEAGRQYQTDKKHFKVPGDTPIDVTSQIEHKKNGIIYKQKVDTGTGGRNRTTTYTYDGALRTTKVEYEDGSKVEYTYDDNGNIETRKDTDKSQVVGISDEEINYSYLYDYFNRMTKKTLDRATEADIDTTYYHDSRSNLVKVTDGEGNDTQHYYDNMDRKIKTEMDYQTTGNSDPVRIEYVYDDNSRLEKIEDYDDNTTEYVYDDCDRIINEKPATHATAGYYTYEYYDDHTLKKRTDPNGTVVDYTYDDADRLTQKDITKAAGIEGPDQEKFYYDCMSRMTKGESYLNSNLISRVEMKYDSFSRMYEEKQTVATSPSVTRTATYDYDHEGNVTKITYPSSVAVDYTPDADINRIGQIKISTTTIVDYDYIGPSKRVLIKDYPQAGVQLERTYDDLRRVTNHKWDFDAQGSTDQEFVYGYDALHYREYEKRVHQSNEGDAYAYDKISQLTNVKYDAENPDTTPIDWDTQVTRTYDRRWNLDTVQVNTNPAITYTTDTVNEYTAIGGNSQTFDDNGNLTDSASTYTADYTAKYDYANRPTEIMQNGTTYDYEYDVFGRRIEKSYSSTTVRYFYAGARVIEETDGSSTPTVLNRYFYGNGIDEVVLWHKASSSKLYYYIDNALGSIIGIVDDSDNSLSESYTYYALGSLRSPAGGSTIGNQYFFTGRRLDETGLYYFRARYYDPAQGRFLQRDLIIDNIVNSYVYVNNNYINHVDPFGYTSEDLPEAENDVPLEPQGGGGWWNLIKKILRALGLLNGDDDEDSGSSPTQRPPFGTPEYQTYCRTRKDACIFACEESMKRTKVWKYTTAQRWCGDMCDDAYQDCMLGYLDDKIHQFWCTKDILIATDFWNIRSCN
ncbi:DUF6531 domain-containing protein [Acidobacteriota bacterium]